MQGVHHPAERRSSRSDALRHWGLPALVVAGVAALVACALLGAPLVAFLVMGLLLLAPLLTWGPIRSERGASDGGPHGG